MNAPETILSVVQENRALRWVAILLAFTVCVLAGAIIFRPPSPVWIVTANGSIHRGDREVLNWEPLEMSRRALEILFVPTDNRDILIDAFYAENLRSSIRSHQPGDRFIAFQIKKVASQGPGNISVDGVLQRLDKSPLAMTLVLVPTARTEINPFGLMIAQGTFDEGGQR